MHQSSTDRWSMCKASDRKFATRIIPLQATGYEGSWKEGRNPKGYRRKQTASKRSQFIPTVGLQGRAARQASVLDKPPLCNCAKGTVIACLTNCTVWSHTHTQSVWTTRVQSNAKLPRNSRAWQATVCRALERNQISEPRQRAARSQCTLGPQV